jgi:hypothetical protein
MVEKPKDFDWVDARKKCSAQMVFESLLAAARRSVESMSKSVDGKPSNDYRFVAHNGSSFVVVYEGDYREAGARFHTNHRGQIIAEAHGYALPVNPIVAGLTLNDEGECRLMVEGVELQEWQFLKRVLEPLFFPLNER